MKIIKVGSCGECCRPTKYNMNMRNVCQFKLIELDNFPNIPDWCPLEDEQDLTPALDILQKYLNEGCYIDWANYRRSQWKSTLGLYTRVNSECVASGKTLKELLVNLVRGHE